MKDDLIYLHHILQAIEDAESFTANNERDDKTFSAVVRQLEIIGEASNRLPLGFRQNQAHIPWRKMIGMRNILIHMYEGISEEDVWSTVTDHLPVLKSDILTLLAKKEQGEL